MADSLSCCLRAHAQRCVRSFIQVPFLNLLAALAVFGRQCPLLPHLRKLSFYAREPHDLAGAMLFLGPELEHLEIVANPPDDDNPEKDWALPIACMLELVPVRNGHVDSTNNNNAPSLRPVGDRGRHPSSSRATLMRLLHATDSCLQLHAPLLAVSKTETSRRPLATEL